MRYREVVWSTCRRKDVEGKLTAEQAAVFLAGLIAAILEAPLVVLPPLLGQALQVATRRKPKGKAKPKAKAKPAKKAKPPKKAARPKAKSKPKAKAKKKPKARSKPGVKKAVETESQPTAAETVE
jgi:outer membrane biosynthesis protein TonB